MIGLVNSWTMRPGKFGVFVCRWLPEAPEPLPLVCWFEFEPAWFPCSSTSGALLSEASISSSSFAMMCFYLMQGRSAVTEEKSCNGFYTQSSGSVFRSVLGYRCATDLKNKLWWLVFRFAFPSAFLPTRDEKVFWYWSITRRALVFPPVGQRVERNGPTDSAYRHNHSPQVRRNLSTRQAPRSSCPKTRSWIVWTAHYSTI